MELEDNSPMPFGLHRGVPMEEVKAKYLLWLWNEGLYRETSSRDMRGDVARYIKKSMAALEKECSNIIVRKEYHMT
jgi:hypothetical protein